MELVTGSRGTSIFSSEKLQEVWNKTVVPELSPNHSIIGVGTITRDGVQAAIIFRKPVQIMNLMGEWIVEGAFFHNWSGGQETEAKVLFKL